MNDPSNSKEKTKKIPSNFIDPRNNDAKPKPAKRDHVSYLPALCPAGLLINVDADLRSRSNRIESADVSLYERTDALSLPLIGATLPPMPGA